MNNLSEFINQPLPVTHGPYKYLKFEHLAAMDIPERGHLLAPWLPEQSITMVHAERGIGKTYFALNVAYAVATGGEYLGWKADKAREVIYLDGEMAVNDMKERVVAISRGEEPAINPNLYILTPDIQLLGTPDLSKPEDQLQVQKAIKNVELIVVDNIATLVRSGNENEAGGWRAVQTWALQQRAAGKSVLFVHHSGKSGNQRGTSNREDVMNTVVKLIRPDDYQEDQGARFEVHFTKARSFYGDDALPIEASLTIDESGVQKWSYKPAETREHRIRELYESGLKQVDIAKALALTPSTVSRTIKKLKDTRSAESKEEPTFRPILVGGTDIDSTTEDQTENDRD